MRKETIALMRMNVFIIRVITVENAGTSIRQGNMNAIVHSGLLDSTAIWNSPLPLSLCHHLLLLLH
jgi:hypothetical protein